MDNVWQPLLLSTQIFVAPGSLGDLQIMQIEREFVFFCGGISDTFLAKQFVRSASAPVFVCCGSQASDTGSCFEQTLAVIFEYPLRADLRAPQFLSIDGEQWT